MSDTLRCPPLSWVVILGACLTGLPATTAPAADPPSRGGLNARPGGPAKPAAPADPDSAEKPLVRPWPTLSPEDQAGATAQRKTFAEAMAAKLGVKVDLKETKYFLFYTNLEAREAANWAGLLDRMYERLADLFAVPKVKREYANLWRGKAVIFVFKDAKDYHAFHEALGAAGAQNTAGMCFSFSNGDVTIGFYRQPDEIDFAHVLVHESVHGFIHRFKSPAPLPNWANEGLAEVIAYELVEQQLRPVKLRQSSLIAAGEIRGHNNTLGGDFYTAAHIDGWQYPVAHTLTQFMIQQSKERYVKFISAIKDGIPWEESLTKKYGVTLERLTGAYGQSVGVKNLQP